MIRVFFVKTVRAVRVAAVIVGASYRRPRVLFCRAAVCHGHSKILTRCNQHRLYLLYKRNHSGSKYAENLAGYPCRFCFLHSPFFLRVSVAVPLAGQVAHLLDAASPGGRAGGCVSIIMMSIAI